MSAPFFIAEAGVNHDGSLDKALRLVDIAADAGADAIKFQTFRAADIANPAARRAEYQQAALGEGSQFEMLRALELDEAAHRLLAERCATRGIEFMSTAFEPWALDMLIGLGMRRIKVPSGEITNLPLIRAMARAGLPIILSTGMADLAEVARAVEWIRQTWAEHGIADGGSDMLTILHCTSNYPTRPEDANLAAMATMRAAFGVPVGYSDHTVGSPVCFAAVALGASVIEKHFTENPSDPGPDHAASIDPAELATLVQEVKAVAASLGNGRKEPRASELPVRALVRRSAYAARSIAAGAPLTPADVIWQRPAGEIGPEDADAVFGASAAADITAGAALSWALLRR